MPNIMSEHSIEGRASISSYSSPVSINFCLVPALFQIFSWFHIAACLHACRMPASPRHAHTYLCAKRRLSLVQGSLSVNDFLPLVYSINSLQLVKKVCIDIIIATLCLFAIVHIVQDQLTHLLSCTHLSIEAFHIASAEPHPLLKT